MRISNWVVPSRRLTSPAQAGTAAPTDVARAHRRHQRPRSPPRSARRSGPAGCATAARGSMVAKPAFASRHGRSPVSRQVLATLCPAGLISASVSDGCRGRCTVFETARAGPLRSCPPVRSKTRHPDRVEALNRRRVDPAEVHPALRHARTETEQTRRAGSVQSAGGRGLPRRMDVNAARRCQARCGPRRRP